MNTKNELVFLVGPGSAGKSTTGRLLANKLGFQIAPGTQEYDEVFNAMKEKRPWGQAQIFLLYHKAITQQDQPFEVLRNEVNDKSDGGSQSTVTVSVNGEIYTVTAKGNGLINAFDLALREALSDKYPDRYPLN